MKLKKGIFIGLVMVAVGSMYPELHSLADSRNSQAEHVVSVPVEGEELLQLAQSKGISPAFQKKDMIELTKEGKLQAQSPEGLSVVQTEDTSAKGIRLTGTKEAFDQTRYVVGDLFDFGESSVGRVVFDGLADKGKNVQVKFFVDDASEPFATIPLENVKRSKKWNIQKMMTFDISQSGITGSHQISFMLDFQSEDSTEETTVVLRSVEFVENTIPVLYINIDETQGAITAMNGDMNHDTECYGDMTLQVPAGYVSEYSGKECVTETYSMEYIRGRGNSTWTVDKKPYKIKLDKKADLLGMGKNKHWVLLANYFDNSLIRNKATYWAGNKLGMEFTPKSAFVDVVMNGEYLGSYVLSDQIRVDKNRVDIDDLEDTDETKQATDEATISGGYLLSMSPYGDEEGKVIQTRKGTEFLIESPSFEGYENETQYNYIRDYVQKTEDAIYGKDFKTEDGISYKDLMDVNSAIDYYLMQEFSMNGDAFLSTSTYLYKKRDGKLYWGPLWDFDFVAWGAYEFSDYNVEGFSQMTAPWFDTLLQDKDFCDALIARWPEFKKQMLALCEDGGQIDVYKNQVSNSAYYDVEKWGLRTMDDLFGGADDPVDMTYDSEIERFKEWIKRRVEWMDANITQFAITECTVTFVVDGKEYEVQKAYSRTPIREFPETPVKDGYIFSGWYQKVVYEEGFEDEIPYQPGAIFTEDTTLYAKWILPSEIVDVKDVVMLQSEKYVNFWNEGLFLEAQVLPLDATFQDIRWYSDNEAVATVDETGYVTLLSNGDVTITAKADNGKQATCMLHVVSDFDEFAYDFELSKTEITLKQGEWGQIDVIPYPENVVDGSYIFLSSDNEVVSAYSTGVIYANSVGETVVVVFCQDNMAMRVCKVTVIPADNSVGTTFTKDNNIYQVVKNTTSKKEVKWLGVKKSKEQIKIPSTVTNKKVKFKVTSIADNALKNKKTVKRIEIGKNVKVIGKNAFKDCKALKSIIVKGTGVKKIGSNAFKGIHSKASIYVPSNKVKSYGKLFAKKGQGKAVDVKKTPSTKKSK